MQCLRIFFKCKNGQFAGKFLAHQMDLGGSRQRQTYMILTTNLHSMERLQQRGRATRPGPHGHWVLQPELELSGQAPTPGSVRVPGSPVPLRAARPQGLLGLRNEGRTPGWAQEFSERDAPCCVPSAARRMQMCARARARGCGLGPGPLPSTW